MDVAAEGEKIRPAVETLQQLIAFLDATTPDPDLEDCDPAGQPLRGGVDGSDRRGGTERVCRI
jgi:hypothetical protein